MTTNEKQQALDQVAQEVKEFKGLDIAKTATNAVPGEGNPNADIIMVGEAPGRNEDLTGRPFVGQAGKLLEKTLQEALDLTRNRVFITNIVKYRPPENRDPFPDEIEACRQWLDQQIEIISPKIIVTLGRYSMAKFIPGVSISGVHGQARFVDFKGKKYIIFPMYHPAAALRAGSMMTQFVADFGRLKNLLGGKPPEVVPEKPKEPEQSSLF
ncbi:MAG: uracil-DNA glycosylase [bacterium]|nr:uracil-DNA glycosylase [bacterium]